MLSESSYQNSNNDDSNLAKRSYRFLMKQLFNVDSFMAYIEPIIQLVNPDWRANKPGAKISHIKHENNSVFTLRLTPSSSWRGFKAGQFVHLSLEKDGAMMTRTFSIASSPSEYEKTGEVAITIKTPPQGKITNWMKEHLKTGDMVYLSQADGDFILQNNLKQKVFIAAGSGLTPIHSMLSNSIHEPWFQNATLLFYINDRQSLFYQAQLEQLKKAGLTVNIIFTEEERRFGAHTLADFKQQLNTTEFYICGPGGLIESCRKELSSLNCPASNVYYEYFGIVSSGLDHTQISEFEDELIQVDYLDSKKQARYDADKFLGKQGATLLEIAEEEGLKPVSGCRIGVCHQCICKKKNGRVLNKKTGQTSDTGEEEIQLCLSVPLGPVELEL